MSMLGTTHKNDLTAGDNSTNNQAHTINITNGLTLTEAKELFLILFSENFLKLRNQAEQIVNERVEEITENFMNRLKEEDPSLLNQFSDPRMQASFYEAQKEYALSGDKDIADMLVDILIERAKVSDKNRQRVILDESLRVASKLTGDQLDLLTVIHFRYASRIVGVDLSSFIQKLAKPFSLFRDIDHLQINDELSFFEHLGLGKLNVTSSHSYAQIIRQNMPAYFMKGFNLSDINAPELHNINVLIRCFHDFSKYQFGFNDIEDLRKHIMNNGISEARTNEILHHFHSSIMTDEEINSYLNSRIPSLQKLEQLNNQTNLQHFQISLVGMAIALTNYNRHFNERYDLSGWIR